MTRGSSSRTDVIWWIGEMMDTVTGPPVGGDVFFDAGSEGRDPWQHGFYPQCVGRPSHRSGNSTLRCLTGFHGRRTFACIQAR